MKPGWQNLLNDKCLFERTLSLDLVRSSFTFCTRCVRWPSQRNSLMGSPHTRTDRSSVPYRLLQRMRNLCISDCLSGAGYYLDNTRFCGEIVSPPSNIIERSYGRTIPHLYSPSIHRSRALEGIKAFAIQIVWYTKRNSK